MRNFSVSQKYALIIYCTKLQHANKETKKKQIDKDKQRKRIMTANTVPIYEQSRLIVGKVPSHYPEEGFGNAELLVHHLNQV